MKMNSNNLFGKLSEDQCEMLLAFSESTTLEDMVKALREAPEPIVCSVPTLSRFLRRAKADKRLLDAEVSDECVEAFAKRAEGGKVREAALAVLRDRMFGAAVDTNNREQFMEVFGALSAERVKEKMLELEERKLKVAEERVAMALECLGVEGGKLLTAGGGGDGPT